MKKVFIKNTKFGLQYQIEGNKGFTYFNDGVNTREDIINHFQSRFDAVELICVNQAGQPSKHYTIKSGERFAGSMFAIVDNDPTKKFLFTDITPDTEKLEWLRYHLPEDQEAEAFENDCDKIKSYLQIADAELKESYKNMIAAKLTREAMKTQCEQNAKTYDPSFFAEIEFND